MAKGKRRYVQEDAISYDDPVVIEVQTSDASKKQGDSIQLELDIEKLTQTAIANLKRKHYVTFTDKKIQIWW